MDWLTIVLRIVHIAAGVFWVGAAATFFLFIEPSTKVLGPNVGPFMEQVNVKRRFPVVVTAASALTVLAGGALYWESSNGLDLAVITSPVGLGFTVGALAGIAAFILGYSMIRPRVERLGAIGAAIGSAGRPPNADETAELQRIESTLKTVGWIDLVLLTVAVVAMAGARYLGG